MKKGIALGLAYLTLQGCTSMQSPIYEPNVNKLVEIGELNSSYDCKDKALIYQQSLDNAGIEGCIVCGEDIVHRKDWFNDEQNGVGHCWNEVYNKETDTWHTVDPSEAYGDNGWETKYNTNKEVWIKFGKGTTLNDIINLTNSTWKDETKLNQENFDRVNAYKVFAEEYDKPLLIPPMRR